MLLQQYSALASSIVIFFLHINYTGQRDYIESSWPSYPEIVITTVSNEFCMLPHLIWNSFYQCLFSDTSISIISFPVYSGIRMARNSYARSARMALLSRFRQPYPAGCHFTQRRLERVCARRKTGRLVVVITPSLVRSLFGHHVR